MKILPKKWIYPENKIIPSELVETTGSSIIAQILINRNIDSVKKIEKFLNLEKAELTTSYIFEHMEKAVERINKAILNKEHIVIYGDFDSDGVTSTSLMVKTLIHLGANVSFYIPDRSTEGHGLNSAAVCRLISSKKAKLLITVDCGISNLSEVTLAKSLGMDVIITDHHEPPEILPPAFAIINPKTMKEDSEVKNLAGVGVAFKLAHALLESNNKVEFADEILYLVAIGTIGDVVPLVGENRTLVYKGLIFLSQKRPLNITKLIEISGNKDLNNITAETISFTIVPRINAIGRLEQASQAVDLLISENAEEIEEISKKLNYNNRIRQQMCESTFIEASQKVNKEIDFEKDRAIILADKNWHPGIIGIVASKLSEKFYRPVFLISIDEENKKARCSARGIEGLNLYEILASIGHLFDQFGGHAFAAGFVLDITKTNFEAFRSTLNSKINETYDSSVLEPKLNIDMNLNSDDLSIELIQEINKLSPFGECNPSPIFSMSNLILKQFKTMGANKNHLKLFLTDDAENTFEAVWWQKNTIDECDILDRVNVAFIPEINTFGDKKRVQFIIKDIKPFNSITSKKEKIITKTNKIEVSDSVKWIDHRKRNDFEKSLTSYLATTNNTVLVFTENKDSHEFLQNNPILSSKIVSRLNIDEVEQLVIYDFPADLSVLSFIIEKSKAKMIHLYGKNNTVVDFKELIKKISSMLKYAFNKKNGEVNTAQLASLLDTSEIVIENFINLLNKSEVIKISKKLENNIFFEFVGSKDVSKIIENSLDYENCLNSLKNVEEFKKELKTNEIQLIKKIISKFNIKPEYLLK